jgi:hypothetical protein
MNEQENIKNDEINLQSDTLTDLPVTDEQAQQAKGGPDSTRSDNIVSPTGWFRYDTTNP